MKVITKVSKKYKILNYSKVKYKNQYKKVFLNSYKIINFFSANSFWLFFNYSSKKKRNAERKEKEKKKEKKKKKKKRREKRKVKKIYFNQFTFGTT